MYSYVACRVCLVTDKQFKTLESDPVIRDGYLNLVGSVDYNPLQTVCLECSTLLRKCSQLKHKCVRTNAILKDIIVKRHGLISYDTIKEVDRKTNMLESNLSSTKLNNMNIPRIVIKSNNLIPKVVKNNAESCGESNIDHSNSISKDNENKENTKQELNVNINNIENTKDVSDDSEIDNVEYLEDWNDILDEEENIEEITEVKRNIKCKKKDDDEPNGKDDDEIKNELQYDDDLINEHTEVIYLTTEMAKQEVLSRKGTSNYNNNPFKCDKCFKAFGVEVAFNNHMEKHTTKFGEVECKICLLRFVTHTACAHHCYNCHKTKFICKTCPYVCYAPKNVVSHVAVHRGKRFECNTCNKIFRTSDSLHSHENKRHSREIVCDLCGKAFRSPRGLHLHKVLRHKKEQNEKRGPFCSECNIHFANDTAWKRHLVLSTKHRISNGCKICGESFNGISELRAHMRVHAGTHNRKFYRLPSKCSKCDHWIENKTEYADHMKSAHPNLILKNILRHDAIEQHICEYCGKIFKKRVLMEYHLRLHTGEKPFKCTECDKEFTFSSGLSLHKQTHRERVKCHLCGRSYFTKRSLAKHLQKHTGVRPYKCELCDKSFFNRCETRLHAKYVHYKQPWPKRDRSKTNKNNNEDNLNL